MNLDMELPELKTQKCLTTDQLSACIYEQLVINDEHNTLLNAYCYKFPDYYKDVNLVKREIWSTISNYVFYDEIYKPRMLGAHEADEDIIKELQNGDDNEKFFASVLTVYNKVTKTINDSEQDGFGIWVY